MTARSDSPVFVIDQVITKWAKGFSEGQRLHPLEIMRLKRLGELVLAAGGEYSDQEAAFDKCFCEADEAERLLIVECYCTRKPMQDVARALGIDRKRVYERLDNTLYYFKGAMRSKGFRI